MKKEKTTGKILAIVVGVVLGLLFLVQIDKVVLFAATLLGLIIISIALVSLKISGKYDIFGGFLGYFTVLIILLFYLIPSYGVSAGSGTVLSNNWFEALNWIKDNTNECSVIATYWDPGHFIVAVAERPVVFDGAGQNVLYERPTNSTEEGLVLENYDNGLVQIKQFEDGNVTTARIKDIGISLTTSNETLAYEILKQYNKPGCDEMYFIASGDLVFKSQWWTYFGTWDPLKPDPKGSPYIYNTLQLTRRKPLFSQATVGYEYAISQSQSFVIYEQNNSYRALFQQNNQFIRVSRVSYPTQFGYVTSEDPDAEIKGTLFVADSNFNVVFFFPEELQDSLFTRMYFYNGRGLQHFEYVNDWGGEFKLFRMPIVD